MKKPLNLKTRRFGRFSAFWGRSGSRGVLGRSGPHLGGPGELGFGPLVSTRALGFGVFSVWVFFLVFRVFGVWGFSVWVFFSV